MIQRHTYTLCALVVTLLLAASGVQAQGIMPPHNDTNNINCLDCHELDVTGGLRAFPTGAEQEQFCKGCHSPAVGAAARDKSDVANHVVNEGTTIIDCNACHNTHLTETSYDTHAGGTTAVNLSRIRSQLLNADGLLMTAIFQVRPGHFSFSEAPHNGICQTCHTQTENHRNDGTGASHEAGNDCMECHTHVSGFAVPEQQP